MHNIYFRALRELGESQSIIYFADLVHINHLADLLDLAILPSTGAHTVGRSQQNVAMIRSRIQVRRQHCSAYAPARQGIMLSVTVPEVTYSSADPWQITTESATGPR